PLRHRALGVTRTIALGQVQEALDEMRLRRARAHEAVGDDVVVPGRAEGAEIPQPGELHRRGSQREDLALRVRRVTVEIDEQLDSIAANAPGDMLSWLRAAIDEVLGRPRDALSERARVTREQAVCEGLDSRAIDALQTFDQQMPDGMIAKVR